MCTGNDLPHGAESIISNGLIQLDVIFDYLFLFFSIFKDLAFFFPNHLCLVIFNIFSPFSFKKLRTKLKKKKNPT
jgi:hypothetical protein